MNLTSEQQQAIDRGQAVPFTVDGRECVLVRKDIYERGQAQYDDGEPQDEELARLGWESGQAIGWDTPEMAEYDDYAYRKTP